MENLRNQSRHLTVWEFLVREGAGNGKRILLSKVSGIGDREQTQAWKWGAQGCLRRCTGFLHRRCSRAPRNRPETFLYPQVVLPIWHMVKYKINVLKAGAYLCTGCSSCPHTYTHIIVWNVQCEPPSCFPK